MWVGDFWSSLGQAPLISLLVRLITCCRGRTGVSLTHHHHHGTRQAVRS